MNACADVDMLDPRAVVARAITEVIARECVAYIVDHFVVYGMMTTNIISMDRKAGVHERINRRAVLTEERAMRRFVSVDGLPLVWQ